MAEKQVALAVGAHPDDVEFNMAGTLSLLVKAGFEPHIFTVSRSELDSNVLPPDEISRIRTAEAKASADIIGATHHPGNCAHNRPAALAQRLYGRSHDHGEVSRDGVLRPGDA